MKKTTALLALALFAGTTAVSMADPYVYANVRVAPGIHVAFGNGPSVVENSRREVLPVAVADRCNPAPIVYRQSFDRRVAYISRWDREHRRVNNRIDRDGDRGYRDFERSYGDHGRRD